LPDERRQFFIVISHRPRRLILPIVLPSPVPFPQPPALAPVAAITAAARPPLSVKIIPVVFVPFLAGIVGNAALVALSSLFLAPTYDLLVHAARVRWRFYSCFSKQEEVCYLSARSVSDPDPNLDPDS
jgi:hypothetical protein